MSLEQLNLNLGPEKDLNQTIKELEELLEKKQLELAKLYEGDIENDVQSAEELDLRARIRKLDGELLKLYNERESALQKKTAESIRQMSETLKNIKKT